jgi:putative phosphoribosyl transferase
VRVLNYDIIDWLNLSDSTIDAVATRELQELQRRDRLYRGDRLPPEICDRVVILVDDGLATGATMRAAISVIDPQEPAKLIVAVPVAPGSLCDDLSLEADEVVCVAMPTSLNAIGYWYEDFSQTTDDEVRQLLANSPLGRPPQRPIQTALKPIYFKHPSSELVLSGCPTTLRAAA